MRGRLWWDWMRRMRGVEIAQVLRAWKGAGVKGVVWDHAAFHKAKAVGEVPRRVESRGEGLLAGRVALYPSSFECPAFMIKKLCL
jgi:hypothetical protein